MRLWELIEDDGGDFGDGVTDSTDIAPVYMPLVYGGYYGYPYAVAPKKKKKKKKRVKEEIVTELTRPQMAHQYHDILSAAGWSCIGAGTYADVYEKPNVPFVLKVFSARDQAYLDFLKVISTHDNPHFPVVKGKLVKISPYFHAVRLEKLTPYRPFELRGEDFLKCVNAYFDVIGGNDGDVKLAEALNDMPTVKEALDIIYHSLSRHRMDLWEYNVMMRGNEIVFIDPVFGD